MTAPDFVIVGERQGDRYWLYASTDLTDAELRSERQKLDAEYAGTIPPRLGRSRYGSRS